MLILSLEVLGWLIALYVGFNMYPAVIVHSLNDSRAPTGVKDFFRMTYLPHLFKCKAKNKSF